MDENANLKKETLGGALLSFRSLQNKYIRAATSKRRDEHKINPTKYFVESY